MPDAILEDPRLATIYDPLDPDRSDLDAYLAIVEELGAHSVLGVGCGTGTFACLLAGRGVEVVGVDPAAASLDVARTKPGAEPVHWVHGDATTWDATLQGSGRRWSLAATYSSRPTVTRSPPTRPCASTRSRSSSTP